MRVLTAITVCACLGGASARAETPLSPDALMDLLVGGSAFFTVRGSGVSAGAEYFPTRTRSFWQAQDGECSWGTVTLTEDLICFRYDDTPARLHCWRPFRDDGVLGYRAERTGEVQMIEPVPGIAPGCTDGLTS